VQGKKGSIYECCCERFRSQSVLTNIRKKKRELGEQEIGPTVGKTRYVWVHRVNGRGSGFSGGGTGGQDRHGGGFCQVTNGYPGTSSQ